MSEVASDMARLGEAEPHTHAWSDAAGGRFKVCSTCGLVVTAHVPAFAYEGSYFTDGGSGGYDFAAPFSIDYDRARFGAELDRLAQQGLRGTLLDIGCATGTYLAAAQRRGWTVTGVETAEFARRQAGARTASSVAASCEDLPAGQRYDVVTMHHVLEHLHDPIAFLRDSVAPRVGRRLLVEVPNFDSLASRVYGNVWRDLRLEQHVCHYTGATLARLLSWAGFRVRRVYTLWQPLWSLRASVELAQLVAGGLRGVDRRWEGSPAPDAYNGGDEKAAYRRPVGVRRLAVAGARIASRPLVSLLERRGYGDRLVVEADPGGRR